MRYGTWVTGPIKKPTLAEMDKKKADALDDMLNRRVVFKEAGRLELDQTELFQRALREREEGLVFGMFVKKVIAPDIRVDEEELKERHRERASEFMSPAMARLEALAFVNSADAEAALDKLRRGADFEWTRTHAPGQGRGCAVCR